MILILYNQNNELSMQFICDFYNLTENHIKYDLNVLIESGLLTKN